MKTTPRTIKEWMQCVENGQIQLPRFQRDEVWPQSLVERFFTAILQKKPLGVFLVLQVNAGSPPFKSRPLKGAPEKGDKCTEQLLDGQQRLTALWRTFNDNYENQTFYVKFEKGFRYEEIKSFPRTGKLKNVIGNPVKEFKEKLIPLKILSPDEKGLRQRKEWIKELGLNYEEETDLETFCDSMRGKFSSEDIPYFLLPTDTSEEDAIDIFIETNTSSVKLTAYDIAVAQMESETEESLTEKADELKKKIPEIENLDADIGDLVLKIYCVMSGKVPTYGQYKTLDFKNLSLQWPKIVEGIKWTVERLNELCICTGKRLPTTVPLRVLPALYQHIPKTGPKHARALRIVKKYLWWAFLSDRYQKQANHRLKEDYDDLSAYIKTGKDEENIRIFKSGKPDKETIKTEGWPKSKRILSRGILSACSLGGAKDIASSRNLAKREDIDFHHIFPASVLRKLGIKSDIALNCMLLDPQTNKEWAKLLPGDFLRKAIKESGCKKPEEEIKKRLKTHLLNHKHLLPVKDKDIDPKDKNAIEKAFREFLDSRAGEVMSRIDVLLDKGDLE
ncbi:MAG: DUF262 domain-containing protein [Candidatus Dadabacteria bacterium]|nr:DUF262 domain-containing protein [Candidatus Dadabacteria bacterium]